MRRSDPELKTLPTGATCATFSLAYRPPPRIGGGAERPSEWCAALTVALGFLVLHLMDAQGPVSAHPG